MSYQIEFAESVKHHLKSLSAAQRQRVFDAIEKQLTHEPSAETRNRKPLRPNPIAPWELRVGNLRVFYDVPLEYPNTVQILAVGWKEGNRLFIGDRLVEL